jgi:hypothetical protein
MDPVMKTFSPYDVVTFSVKAIGSVVAATQVLLVELDTLLVVVVIRVVVPEAVPEEVPQSPLPVTQELGTSTRGRPDAIGTGMLPFESTWTDEQVYISTS